MFVSRQLREYLQVKRMPAKSTHIMYVTTKGKYSYAHYTSDASIVMYNNYMNRLSILCARTVHIAFVHYAATRFFLLVNIPLN